MWKVIYMSDVWKVSLLKSPGSSQMGNWIKFWEDGGRVKDFEITLYTLTLIIKHYGKTNWFYKSFYEARELVFY